MGDLQKKSSKRWWNFFAKLSFLTEDTIYYDVTFSVISGTVHRPFNSKTIAFGVFLINQIVGNQS
jgi:hypothetical protein